MAAYQYVYVMKDVTKAYPGGREVFKGITLSFLPGVKIGVLGVNGAGKSTLLKIMAGVEKEFGGEAWAADGVRIGYLEQEPQLDPTKTVGENVAEAFAVVKAALTRFKRHLRALHGAHGRRRDETTSSPSRPISRRRSDAGDGWEMDRRIEIALDALRCPPADSDVTKALGRRAPPRRPLPPAAGEARSPAARRADQPSRRRERRVARNIRSGNSPAR